jgi:hypothetical protein
MELLTVAVASFWVGVLLSMAENKSARVLAGADFRRVEATGRVGFDAAHRWFSLLGFDAEGVMRGYGPDGADHVRYARVTR